MQQGLGDRREILDKASEPWLTVVDDLGAGHNTDYFVSEILGLLESRLGKWTFITTNLTLSGFEELDQRIASRLRRDGNQFGDISLGDYTDREERNH